MLHNIDVLLTPSAATDGKTRRHNCGRGLYLLVENDGAGHWLYRYHLDGHWHELGLGPAGAGGLALHAVRKYRAKLAAMVKAGVDPAEELLHDVTEAMATAHMATFA